MVVAHSGRHAVTAREDVLARIRDALGDGAAAHIDIPRGYRMSGTRDRGDSALLDLLQERLVDYRATVHRTDENGISSTVVDILRDRGASSIAKAPGLRVELGSDISVLTDDEARSITMLDAVDGVVTGCAVAVAETGTIVLDASPACGHRALTLVPDFYVVVVRRQQVVESVSEALSALDPRAALTWVSGPSATSDIELSRVEGVHGPRTLVVVLVG
jgi:L-lactate dehydrogenase complex protein LldG